MARKPATGADAVQGSAKKRRLELPTIIFGTAEIHRLQRELEVLEDFLQQAAIRQAGKQPQLPRTSRILETLAGNNNLNLLTTEDRATLRDFLGQIDSRAPVIHMSFASDPSAAFTAKVVAWFRSHIHPYTLVRLGLQPTLAAGCIVRTPNKVFDFSLRGHFSEKRELLLKALDAKGPATTPAAVAASTPASAGVAASPEAPAEVVS